VFSKIFRPALGPTQSLVLWVGGVKWLGQEVDHLPPCGVMKKNVCVYGMDRIKFIIYLLPFICSESFFVKVFSTSVAVDAVVSFSLCLT
jgi:hypothetical protein